MKIVCPQCRTAYDVTPAALGSAGRQVRCVRCRSVWFAELSKPAANIIPAVARAAPLSDATPAASSTPAAVPADPAVAPPSADAAASGPDSADTGDTTPDQAEPPAAPEGAAAAAPPPAQAAAAAETDAPAAAQPAPAPPKAATAADEPAPAPTASTPEAPDAAPEPVVDVESVAARRIPARRPTRPRVPPNWRVRGLTTAIILLGVINASVILGRAEIVRVLPQTASLFEAIGLRVNLRDLGFKNIKTTQETHDGVSILVIEGTIVATGRSVADVPRLRFAIGAANGHEIYAWTALPTRTKLAPGETLPFRTRLASPPEQGRSVKIRFFTRHDLAAGLR